MLNVSARYDGNLRCTVTHDPSGATLVTDAPKDNHGKGEYFSPTDLVGAALSSCALTIMAIAAKAHGVPMEGVTATTQKEMSAAPPRRIAKLITRVVVPLPPDHPKRSVLETAAKSCQVHKSLAAEIDAPIEFVWSG